MPQCKGGKTWHKCPPGALSLPCPSFLRSRDIYKAKQTVHCKQLFQASEPGHRGLVCRETCRGCRGVQHRWQHLEYVRLKPRCMTGRRSPSSTDLSGCFTAAKQALKELITGGTKLNKNVFDDKFWARSIGIDFCWGTFNASSFTKIFCFYYKIYLGSFEMILKASNNIMRNGSNRPLRYLQQFVIIVNWKYLYFDL